MEQCIHFTIFALALLQFIISPDWDTSCLSTRTGYLATKRGQRGKAAVSGCSTVVRWVDCLSGGEVMWSRSLLTQNLFVPKKAKLQDNDADRANAVAERPVSSEM